MASGSHIKTCDNVTDCYDITVSNNFEYQMVLNELKNGRDKNLCFSGLKTDDYVQLVWTTFAEFPGTVLALLLIDRIGRKKSLALQAAIFTLATLCLVGCGGSRSVIWAIRMSAVSWSADKALAVINGLKGY